MSVLAIVEAGFGGVDLFNQALRNILSRIQSTNDEEREGLQLFFADSAIPDFLGSPTTRESRIGNSTHSLGRSASPLSSSTR